jgi:predicted kinase
VHLILLTGLIASGKSTIAQALTDRLISQGQNTVCLDLDSIILEMHGSFIWNDEESRSLSWLDARRVASERVNHFVAEGKSVVVSGPFYLEDEILGVTKHLDPGIPTFLFSLFVPLALRLERNQGRSRVSPEEELLSQEAAFLLFESVPGEQIHNHSSEIETVSELLTKLNDSKGLISS